MSETYALSKEFSQSIADMLNGLGATRDDFERIGADLNKLGRS